MGIGITEAEQKIIIDILNNYKHEYCFYYYGSRVKGTFEKTSDLDILIKGQKEMPLFLLEDIKEKFDASKLPYIVNFSDYYSIDERFYNRIKNDLFPYDWKECHIGDLCDSVSETYNGNHRQVILINTSDVLEGKILNHIAVENKNLKGQFKKTFKKNDILYSEIRPANKRFAFVDIGETYNYIASTKLMVIRPNTELILPKYLYMILKAQPIIDELQHLAETRSGTFPQITFSSELATMKIELPPLETQQKIVKVLSAIDDKIELNNKINENLEQQAQAIFKSWFVDFEPFGGTMPEDWEEGKIGDYVEIKRGGSPRPIQNYIAPQGYKWLKISDATCSSNPYILEIKECIKETGLNKTVYLKTGDIVLSNSATPGIPKILDVDTCIHDGWLYFPSSKFSNEYLYLLFKNIRAELVSLGNGSVFTNLKTDILRNFNTILPNQETLNKFNKIIKPIFVHIRNNQREVKYLTQLRDTLLPKLMSGEIDVEKVEI